MTSLLADKIPLNKLYLELYQRAMYTVGTKWQCNEISVATEHLATAITDSLLNLSYPLLFGTERIGRSAIISCVAGEHHQLGPKMIADLFEMQGWDCHFPGRQHAPQ